ncbi:MAG: hypothetical protein AAF621_02435, partial [Pseudomonadota bacterium]
FKKIEIHGDLEEGKEVSGIIENIWLHGIPKKELDDSSDDDSDLEELTAATVGEKKGLPEVVKKLFDSASNDLGAKKLKYILKQDKDNLDQDSKKTIEMIEEFKIINPNNCTYKFLSRDRKIILIKFADDKHIVFRKHDDENIELIPFKTRGDITSDENIKKHLNDPDKLNETLDNLVGDDGNKSIKFSPTGEIDDKFAFLYGVSRNMAPSSIKSAEDNVLNRAMRYLGNNCETIKSHIHPDCKLTKDTNLSYIPLDESGNSFLLKEGSSDKIFSVKAGDKPGQIIFGLHPQGIRINGTHETDLRKIQNHFKHHGHENTVSFYGGKTFGGVVDTTQETQVIRDNNGTKGATATPTAEIASKRQNDKRQNDLTRLILFVENPEKHRASLRKIADRMDRISGKDDFKKGLSALYMRAVTDEKLSILSDADLSSANEYLEEQYANAYNSTSGSPQEDIDFGQMTSFLQTDELYVEGLDGDEIVKLDPHKMTVKFREGKAGKMFEDIALKEALKGLEIKDIDYTDVDAVWSALRRKLSKLNKEEEAKAKKKNPDGSDYTAFDNPESRNKRANIISISLAVRNKVQEKLNDENLLAKNYINHNPIDFGGIKDNLFDTYKNAISEETKYQRMFASPHRETFEEIKKIYGEEDPPKETLGEWAARNTKYTRAAGSYLGGKAYNATSYVGGKAYNLGEGLAVNSWHAGGVLAKAALIGVGTAAMAYALSQQGGGMPGGMMSGMMPPWMLPGMAPQGMGMPGNTLPGMPQINPYAMAAAAAPMISAYNSMPGAGGNANWGQQSFMPNMGWPHPQQVAASLFGGGPNPTRQAPSPAMPSASGAEGGEAASNNTVAQGMKW